MVASRSLSSDSLRRTPTTSAHRTPITHPTPMSTPRRRASRTETNSPILLAVGARGDRRPSDGDQLMRRWEQFFRMVGPNKVKRLQAMAKLTQLAIVQYMRTRDGVYSKGLFKKSGYQGIKFYLLNTDKTAGKELHDILAKIGACITTSALRALRFQIFHDPEKSNEVGEEIYFKFYYGEEPRATLDFGQDTKIELDMKDCSFERFVECFGTILGTIQGYKNLKPLPPNAEKRIRTSFRKRPPADFKTGPFCAVTGDVQYATDVVTEQLGTARLQEVGVGAILRTRYLR